LDICTRLTDVSEMLNPLSLQGLHNLFANVFSWS